MKSLYSNLNRLTPVQVLLVVRLKIRTCPRVVFSVVFFSSISCQSTFETFISEVLKVPVKFTYNLTVTLSPSSSVTLTDMLNLSSHFPSDGVTFMFFSSGR